MKKIGLLSDTHAYLHPKIFEHFKNCDENFIISGYQTTKDDDGNKTKVFYLNKVQIME